MLGEEEITIEEFGQLKLKKNKLDQRLRLETKKNEVSQTHFKQLQNMVRTQIDQLVGDQKQQVERFDEIVEDMIDALYDYEEQMEDAGAELLTSNAENFEDVKPDALKPQNKIGLTKMKGFQDAKKEMRRLDVAISHLNENMDAISTNSRNLRSLKNEIMIQIKTSLGDDISASRCFWENKRLTKRGKDIRKALANEVGDTGMTADPREMAKEEEKETQLLSKINDLQTLLNEAAELLAAQSKSAAEATRVQKENSKLTKTNKELDLLLMDSLRKLDASGAGSNELRLKRQRQQITQFQAEVDDMRKLNDETSGRIKSLLSGDTDTTEQGSLLDLEEKISEVESMLSVMGVEVTPSESSAQDATKILEEVEELKAKVAKLQAEADEKNKHASKSQKRINELKGQVAELKAENEEIVKELKVNAKTIKTKSKGATATVEQKKELTKQIAKRQKRFQSASSKSAALDEQESSLAEQLIDLRDKGGTLSSYISRMSTQMRAIKKSLSNVRSEAEQETAKLTPGFRQIASKLETFIEENAGEQKRAIDEYMREFLLRKAYYNYLQDLRGNIRVFARVRPLLPFEKKKGCVSCVAFPRPDELTIRNIRKQRENTWEFDKVYNCESTNVFMFEEVKPLVTSILDGFNVCIFAYGQTGAGKTYTMEGCPEDPGINKRALSELFDIKKEREKNFEITIVMTLLEIYMDKIRDLLAKKKKGEVRGKGPGLKIKKGPDGNYVEHLTRVEVSSRKQLDHNWAFGMKNRSTASTKMNDQSSRSHCMLSVYLKCKNKLSGKTLNGKLHLIDLAGSERLNKSKVTGDAKKEAVAINKSLTCLGDVIFARANKSGHVPYRNSKLTYALEDSLAGDSKTMMIAQISPADYNSGESYCTMAFANRVQKVELGKAKAHGDDDH